MFPGLGDANLTLSAFDNTDEVVLNAQEMLANMATGSFAAPTAYLRQYDRYRHLVASSAGTSAVGLTIHAEHSAM